MAFGGKKSDQATMAVDAEGNIYKMKSNICHSLDVEELPAEGLKVAVAP